MATRVVPRLEAQPLTPERWSDLVSVFGPEGGQPGCWCMFWRISRKAFEANRGEVNRAAFKGIVDSGCAPGLLYYEDNRPIGWCSIAPRSDYPALNRSPVFRAVDDRPVWAIVCFFLVPPRRGSGLTLEMVRLALDFARDRGAEAVEAYPNLAARTQDGLYMGVDAVYRRLGFKEIARRRPNRPILRCELPHQS